MTMNYIIINLVALFLDISQPKRSRPVPKHIPIAKLKVQPALSMHYAGQRQVQMDTLTSNTGCRRAGRPCTALHQTGQLRMPQHLYSPIAHSNTALFGCHGKSMLDWNGQFQLTLSINNHLKAVILLTASLVMNNYFSRAANLLRENPILLCSQTSLAFHRFLIVRSNFRRT